jgi:hypothetical protein
VARIALALVVFVLVVHGLIHLMGTAVYMRFGEVKGLTYKTTLLSGHWELGEGGIRVFGALWVLPTMGFVAAAFALATGGAWWQPVLLWTTLLSLALTGLDWSNAFMGAITDTAILVLLWLRPHIADWFS